MRTLSLLLVSLLLSALAAGAAEQLYTCGMHPQVIRQQPGSCPICGMDLTPIRDAAAAGDALQITIDPVTIQRMNLKTAPVTKGPIQRSVRSVGVVAFDESGRRDVTTKYEGWLEKLHVDTSGAPVKAGDPLFDIYAPDLYNAQVNYLVARRAETGESGVLTRSALERMRLLDLPEPFIEELVQRGAAQRTFTYRAPADGVVIEKMAVQGQMLRPGEVVYRLADLSRVWVLAQVYENDLALVQAGQPAQIKVTFGPAQWIDGEVTLVMPELEPTTRTATARIVVPNPQGTLRPGMYVDVRFASPERDAAVLVPESAVLRSGEHNTVFVALDGGRFEPREVTLGLRTDAGFYEVQDGLHDGERVVVSGQFLLDSESQRREAIQKMLRAETGTDSAAEGGAPPPGGLSAPTPPVTLPAGVTVYTCPMDIHAHVVADAPGKCGECGMELVPADTVTHGEKSKAIWLQEHGDHAH